MPSRQILILDKNESAWKDFLKEYFEDTSSRAHILDEPAKFAALLERGRPDVIFINEGLASSALLQKIKSYKKIMPALRVFRIGGFAAKSDPEIFDASFLGLPVLYDFQKQITQYLVYGEKIDVLVIDDEHEIGKMIRGYLEDRKQPAFEIRHAENGKRGLEMIEEKKPDVLVLDIKMPVMDGRDVYREIRKIQMNLPVIIFFDSVAAEEMLEIRRYGNPAVVEKGGRESAMPEMLSLIKKLAYFG